MLLLELFATLIETADDDTRSVEFLLPPTIFAVSFTKICQTISLFVILIKVAKDISKTLWFLQTMSIVLVELPTVYARYAEAQ